MYSEMQAGPDSGQQAVTNSYIVELLDRSGQVRERLTPSSEKLVLGRGYDCDVIIDDAYLCARHVEIQLDDDSVLHVRDLDSVNGISRQWHGDKETHITLRVDEDCFLGWTRLRFRSRQSAVAPARQDYSRQFLFSIFQRPAWLALLTSLPVVHLLFVTWMEQSRDIEWHDLLIVPASVYLALSAWALVWAIIGRIIVHRAMFLTHLAIGTVMTSVSLLFETGISYSAFILDIDGMQNAAIQLTTFLASIALLYLHFHFATRMNAGRQLATALSFSLLISGIGLYFDYTTRQGFSSSPDYIASLKPPAYVFTAPVSTERFFADYDDLKARVDERKQETD